MAIAGVSEAAPALHGQAHHVVVMVWDGMRPDFVSEKTTPNLWKLSQEGVFFRHHHPAYPSSTEVNGTVMATGVYPEHSGLMANREYRPEADPLKPVGTELPATMLSYSTKPYIAVPTVAEMLHAAGFKTAVAGSKGVALLQDWSAIRPVLARDGTPVQNPNPVIFDGQTVPGESMAELTGTLGAWPPTIEFPNTPRDQWTTAALMEMWRKDASIPAYSMLWMSDPDYSQHQMAPGSEMALSALKSVDDRLGTVLAALDTAGLRHDTDVFVISDHGFSTVERTADLLEPLRTAGLRVTGTGFDHQPQSGDVLAVGLGGSMAFYIINHDKEIGRKLSSVVQKSVYSGVIFTRWGLPGTFDLHTGHIATKEAPDVVVSFGWNGKPNVYGAPGSLDAAGVKPGKGTHASLSSYDMHNTLIAAGPDFKAGWEDQTPTGNVDLAPTVLWILGVQPQQPLDGRVLLEAMPGHTLGRKVSQQTLHASNPAEGWKQYLKVSRVGTTEYFDEGNRE